MKIYLNIILPSMPGSSRWSLFPQVSLPKLRIHLSSPRRERDGCKFEYAMTVTGLEDVPDGQSVRGGWVVISNSVRNTVPDYCLTDAGVVSWQMVKI
jgi:hypothetical protein